jgi:hypothetical protein
MRKSLWIICRCIARRRFMRATEWNWTARPWRSGWGMQSITGAVVGGAATSRGQRDETAY